MAVINRRPSRWHSLVIVAVIGVSAVTGSASAASVQYHPATMAAVVAAAEAGETAYFSSTVAAQSANFDPASSRGMMPADASAALSRAKAVIAATMTGSAAATQVTIASDAFELAMVRVPASPGEAVSVINVGGGIRNFTVKSVSIVGSSATVKATLTSWLATRAFYPDGTSQTFSPANDTNDTITLRRDATHGWRVSSFHFSFINGTGP